MNATSYLAPQHGHLMPERGVLRRNPALRPKGRGEQREQKIEQREHDSLTIGDSPAKSTRMEFSVNTGAPSAAHLGFPDHRAGYLVVAGPVAADPAAPHLAPAGRDSAHHHLAAAVLAHLDAVSGS